ncbi:hypothetical protein [Haloarcula sp. Atlit-7R]|uniref:hypothetical protein n=1 Tax=Haloarcula sp. Atlit-7R TaxID=2282125 RepID=UPI000EF14B8B|nr:hypothetical protein [Haloarcula sp. Atlit-7R]RLM94393.1 hypothetical protein D3D01_16145 [Haloarcula sp. Atlit-7R]
MIRTGEKYIVESPEQFVELTKFSKIDVLKASDTDFLKKTQGDLLKEESELESVSDLPESLVNEYFNSVEDPIQATLEADSGEWVHLYDGAIHTIINLEPLETPVWAEGEITPEGFSASLYREAGLSPSLLDEYWITWSEIIDGEHSWASFQDTDIDVEKFTLKGRGQ